VKSGHFSSNYPKQGRGQDGQYNRAKRLIAIRLARMIAARVMSGYGWVARGE